MSLFSLKETTIKMQMFNVSTFVLISVEWADTLEGYGILADTLALKGKFVL